VTDDYFDEQMVSRERLLFTVATRRQLERWEPYVAEHARRLLAERQLDALDTWSAQIEHHFALIAARNLMRALELDPPSAVPVDSTLRAEVIEGRDLHEHWPENLPIFNVQPRVATPGYRSGKDFAARNPDKTPFWWLRFSHAKGALLTPNVPAPQLHELLDAVEEDVLTTQPWLGEYVPPRAPSAWIQDNGEWWPKPH
jgi:hypothetical protein